MENVEWRHRRRRPQTRHCQSPAANYPLLSEERDSLTADQLAMRDG